MADSQPTDTARFAATTRTTLKRHAERGSYDRALVHAIIDETFVCHVGFADAEAAVVLPTAHVRIGDALYLHGARGNHMLRALCDGREAAVAFTLLDGLVFAARAFHHSMNFRSAMLIGRGIEVSDAAEKRAALTALVEHMAHGRMREVIAPSDEELRATLVVRLPISEVSAKVRSGPPAGDSSAEHAFWTGEVPLALRAEPGRRTPGLPAHTPFSEAASTVLRARGATGSVPLHWQRGDGVFVSTDRSLLDVAFVHDYLAHHSYWARGIALSTLQRAIEHSLCFGVYREHAHEPCAQIGFARVTTDFARTAHLADVFIADGMRGAKLGTFLIECVLAHPELRDVPRWLLGTKDAHGFYARFGFAPDTQGRVMGRVREGR